MWFLKQNTLNKARKTQFSHIISEKNRTDLEPLQRDTFQLKSMVSAHFYKGNTANKRNIGSFFIQGDSGLLLPASSIITSLRKTLSKKDKVISFNEKENLSAATSISLPLFFYLLSCFPVMITWDAQACFAPVSGSGKLRLFAALLT